MPAGMMVVVGDIGVAAAGAAREWAQSLADRSGMAVDFSRAEPEEVAQACTGVGRPLRTWQLEPAAPTISAAEFRWRDDGTPDWGSMWQTFCELALFGGPPHRGEDAPVTRQQSIAERADDWDAIAEIRRGIAETTGLDSAPATDGWLTIDCDSERMAAWMAASIILENVEARCEGARLLVPAASTFRLQDEVKSVVTVVAKVHHYWIEHVSQGRAWTLI